MAGDKLSRKTKIKSEGNMKKLKKSRDTVLSSLKKYRERSLNIRGQHWSKHSKKQNKKRKSLRFPIWSPKALRTRLKKPVHTNSFRISKKTLNNICILQTQWLSIWAIKPITWLQNQVQLLGHLKLWSSMIRISPSFNSRKRLLTSSKMPMKII